jgi:hypothetical protein
MKCGVSHSFVHFFDFLTAESGGRNPPSPYGLWRDEGRAAAARFWMESPVLSRHSPRRRGIIPAGAGSAAIEFLMLDEGGGKTSEGISMEQIILAPWGGQASRLLSWIFSIQ